MLISWDSSQIWFSVPPDRHNSFLACTRSSQNIRFSWQDRHKFPFYKNKIVTNSGSTRARSSQTILLLWEDRHKKPLLLWEYYHKPQLCNGKAITKAPSTVANMSHHNSTWWQNCQHLAWHWLYVLGLLQKLKLLLHRLWGNVVLVIVLCCGMSC